MPATSVITIDGSLGEGGGGLLRTALGMAALTQQGLRMEHVRGGTKFSGLDAEDIVLIKALGKSCGAELVNVEAGAPSFSFIPRHRPKPLNGPLEGFRTENRRGPGALIVLSGLLPTLAKAGAISSVSVAGESYGHNTLTFDLFANVTLPLLRKLGLYAQVELEQAAFGREAQGSVSMEVEPSALTGFDGSSRGVLKATRAVVAYSGLPQTAAQRASHHLQVLGENAGVQIDVDLHALEDANPGMYVSVWAQYERGAGGFGVLGSRGVRAETLAQHVFQELFDWMRSDATVDAFTADHLLLPAILAEGPTVFSVPRLTSRFLTRIRVIKQFAPIHLTVKGAEGGPGTVSIRA